MAYLFLYFSIFFSLLFFCFCFLEGEPLKSCIMFCLGVLFMSGFISLGYHIWYSYFMVLIFLSGVLSLLSYVSSLVNYGFSFNYFFVGLFFFFIFFCLCFFDGGLFIDFFIGDYGFLLIYYDLSYLFIFWVVVVLILLLNFISYNLGVSFCLRGL